MYVCQLTFPCDQDVDIESAQSALSLLLDQYRYNGQIIGREFPVILNQSEFEVVFVCPEQDSLAVANNNDTVIEAYDEVRQVGLGAPIFELKGLESQSDFVDNCSKPAALILYSTYLQSCSPIRCFEHFSPVPLYKLPESVRKPLIKWQENHAACDQLQMNALTEIEQQAINQLSLYDSELSQQGAKIANEISQQLQVPVYLYLYRVGGDSEQNEYGRQCPQCGSDWKLEQSLFGLFDFKCDNCFLLSNISWDWQ